MSSIVFHESIMTMKLMISLVVLAVSGSAFAEQVAVEPTVVEDKAAAKKLLGTHGLTLQWITEGKKQRGEVVIEDVGGTYRLRGEQRDAKGNYVTVAGRVTRIEKGDFWLEGKIVTRVDYLADGKECPKEGLFRFHIKGARKFWRLQEMENPCAGETHVDYVDVHF
jgi:hypothetical protein